MERIRFKTEGYDPTFDYIKGLSILFVILTHCINSQMHQYSLFCLWGDMAVPIFILIQIFHAYKKGLGKSKHDLGRIYKRVLRPFLVIQVLLFALMVVGGGKFSTLCSEFIESGGQGAGSYYVWIYVQFALILPWVAPLLSKMNKLSLLIVMIMLSEALEILCSEIQIASWLYRLLMFRYVFLIYCGIELLRDGIVISKSTMALSIISAAAILVFNYTDMDMQPFFFKTGWKVFHWPCYFFVSGLLLYLLVKSFDYMKQEFAKIHSIITDMGKFSYEIFLFQMVFFFFLAYVRNRLGSIQDTWVFDILVLIISPIICVFPVLIYKKLKTIRS